MISGIYQLKFIDGSIYIGKSVDIPRRLSEHYKSLVNEDAAAKLQCAYNKYGMPIASILQECHSNHIDSMETFYIMKLVPSLNSAKTAELSSAEYYVLERNIDNLKFSTCYHLQLLEDQAVNVSSYVGQIVGLKAALIERDAELYNEAIARIGTELIDIMEKDYDALDMEFEAYKSLPWYKKIWN